jgi:hypothetical protein
MGLEPTTFCMANASARSLPFAPVRLNQLLAGVSVRPSERERTRANAEPCHPCHRSSPRPAETRTTFAFKSSGQTGRVRRPSIESAVLARRSGLCPARS